MKILGIVAEYNPFHNGHLYHIKQAKKISDFIIVIMSGNYVQRGEPAIINKYLRTRAALQNGIDLVLELPIYFATSSAEIFAYGAIKSLHATGIIDTISFGCECNDITILTKISDMKNKFDIKKEMSNGKSYPLAFQNFIAKNLPGYEKFILPNNILALEYLTALKKINWHPQIYPVKRKIAMHNENELNVNFSSAYAIRNAIKNGKNVAKFLPYQFDFQNYTDINNASNILHYLIATKKLTNNILGINEGIENRIKKAAQNNFLISDIIQNTNSKRYTNSKISRIILHAILDMQKNDFATEPKYLRVLGFRKQSQILLTMISKKSLLPLITNLKNSNLIPQKEIASSDLYFNFMQAQKFFPQNFEYTQPLVIE